MICMTFCFSLLYFWNVMFMFGYELQLSIAFNLLGMYHIVECSQLNLAQMIYLRQKIYKQVMHI